MTLAIVDTNVLFAALAATGATYPARTVEAVRLRTVESAFSEALLAEYLDVLSRPSAQRRHGLSGRELSDYLYGLRTVGRVVATGPGPASPERSDQHLWDLLASEPEAILVTGDATLLASNAFPGRILSPREFVERYLEPETD